MQIYKHVKRKKNITKKRILGIWDFSLVPYSLGDLLTFIQRLQVDKIKYKAEKFDICFVYDIKNPTRKFGDQGVTIDNFHYHFVALMSLAYSNKNLGSFFIFDDYNRLFKFAEDNKNYYQIVPEIDIIKQKKFYYRNNFNYIQDYFKKTKHFPYYEFRQGTLQNVFLFFNTIKQMLLKYPVVCHIRNSKSQSERNANLEAWSDFFKEAESLYKEITFIIIGTKQETEYFRGCSKNIIFSKDYLTSPEYDMALISMGLCFMGTRSGPLMMSFFSGVPCRIFGYKAVWEDCKPNQTFLFANNFQKLIWQKENKEMLLSEFDFLYQNIDREKWYKNIEKYKVEKQNKSNIEL